MTTRSTREGLADPLAVVRTFARWGQRLSAGAPPLWCAAAFGGALRAGATLSRNGLADVSNLGGLLLTLC